MHITISANGEVDFKAPVYMSNEQYERFCEFMVGFVRDVEREEVKEKKRVVVHKVGKSKKWTPHERLLLLSSDSNKALESKLGRSGMSVIQQRGSFLSEYLAWAKKRGHAIKKDDLNMRKKFLKEKGYL